MNEFFNPDNIAMRALTKFCDFIALNFLFIISCIPIITIGTALTSLYSVTLKMTNNTEAYIAKGYWKAFKANFKQSTLLWIPILLAGIFFGVDLYVVLFVIGEQFKLLQIPIWIFLFLLFSLVTYGFPIIAKFESPTKDVIKNSLLISIANIPNTIFFLVIDYVIIRFFITTSVGFGVIFSIFLFFGFAALNYFYSIFINKIFNKITGEDEEVNEDELTPLNLDEE